LETRKRKKIDDTLVFDDPFNAAEIYLRERIIELKIT
jgi:hypothetical protein